MPAQLEAFSHHHPLRVGFSGHAAAKSSDAVGIELNLPWLAGAAILGSGAKGLCGFLLSCR